MRLLPAAALAAILAAGAAPALAQSQPSVITPSAITPGNESQENGGVAVPQAPSVIAVPPAPPIVAAPLSTPVPAAPATPAPPGLVPVNPPAASGDNINLDNGAAPGGNSGAASPGANPPNAPASTAGGNAAGGTAAATPAPQDQDTIPVPPNTWLPETSAELGVLDKVGGGVSRISVPVGGKAVVGDLQVNVLACVIRPPDQIPDAAVFLALQNADDPSQPPEYRGWLLRSAPGAAVAGDASETFRIIGCS